MRMNGGKHGLKDLILNTAGNNNIKEEKCLFRNGTKPTLKIKCTL